MENDPAMQRDPPQSQADAVRGEILRHARDLFSHYGFWKTNIGDIAKRSGMSPANLYRYFRNKQAIGLAVVQGHFAEAQTLIDAAMAEAAPDPEAEIRALIRAAVEHIVTVMRTNPRTIELAEFVLENDEGWGLLTDYFLFRRRRLTECLARGMAEGRFREADPAATAIALQHCIKAFWMPFSVARWRDPTTIMPELEQVLDLVFAGIRAPDRRTGNHDRDSPPLHGTDPD